jgi:hypothetical protein
MVRYMEITQETAEVICENMLQSGSFHVKGLGMLKSSSLHLYFGLTKLKKFPLKETCIRKLLWFLFVCAP